MWNSKKNPLSTPAFRLAIATSWLAPDSHRAAQEQAIRVALDDAPDWQEFLHLVDRHRIPALSWAALQRTAGVQLPDEVRTALQQRSRRTQFEALRRSMLLAEVLAAGNRAGIPLMPLKGPLLSLELYGDLGLRQSHDLDLQCRLEDVFNACRFLKDLGWHPDFAISSLTPRQREKFFRYDVHLGFVQSSSGQLLELHWHDLYETTAQTQARWTAGLSCQWRDTTYQAMTPDDLAWYLCMHGCRHAWFRLKWTGDLARLHAEGKIDWARGLENARAAGLQKSVLATQALLRELYDLSITKNERENASSRAESRLLALMRGAIAAPETHGTPSELFRPHFYEWTAGPRKTLWAFFKQKLYRREDYLLLPLSNRFFWLYVPLRLLSFFWRHWRHA